MKNKEQSAAILTIKGAGKMTPRGRREIARWLVRNAENLVKDGKDYDGNFRARYIY